MPDETGDAGGTTPVLPRRAAGHRCRWRTRQRSQPRAIVAVPTADRAVWARRQLASGEGGGRAKSLRHAIRGAGGRGGAA